MKRILGNIIWLILGGFESAIGYFSASLALAVTIVGLPWAYQTFKLGILCLWPFGAEIVDSGKPSGCLRIPLNLLWIIFGGLFSFLCHIFFGLILCITIIGIPWGSQHFKMAQMALAPFGREIKLNL